MIATESYDMLGFAEARNILPDDKLQEVYSKIEQRERMQRQEIAELEEHDMEVERQFEAKYGDKSGWSKDVWREYYYTIGYLDR